MLLTRHGPRSLPFEAGFADHREYFRNRDDRSGPLDLPLMFGLNLMQGGLTSSLRKIEGRLRRAALLCSKHECIIAFDLPPALFP